MIQSKKTETEVQFLKMLLASDSELSCMLSPVPGKYDISGFV
jgi:hypothetical protein